MYYERMKFKAQRKQPIRISRNTRELSCFKVLTSFRNKSREIDYIKPLPKKGGVHMSRKHRHEYCYDEKGLSNCCCSLETLVILILIILQFNKNGHGLFGANNAAVVGSYGNIPTVDNSILFIIALFFLSCCNPCTR